MKWLSTAIAHKRLTITFVACFCLIGLFPMSDQGTFAVSLITIDVPETTKVNQERITLGMISEIKVEDRQLLKKLQNIYLISAPGPGQSQRISNSYIQTRLKQNHIPLKSVVLNAPPEILLIGRSVEVSKPMIEKAVLAYIFKHMPWNKNDTKIKKIRVSQKVVLPPGKVTYRVEAPGNIKYKAAMTLPVNFYVDGKPRKKIWVSVSLGVMKEVLVTRRLLGRYQPITQDDITLKKVDIATLSSDVILGYENILGKRTKRKIRVGTVLRETLIELPPLIKPGDLVTLVAESAGMKITTHGVAKKKGRKGEMIMVVNLDSKKRINAQVVDANTVKVDF